MRLIATTASLSVWSSRYYLSPNSPPRCVAYSVAISSGFSDLSVGLHLSQRNGRFQFCFLFGGFSRYGQVSLFLVEFPIGNSKNPDVLLHRKLDDAERYYRLGTPVARK